MPILLRLRQLKHSIRLYSLLRGRCASRGAVIAHVAHSVRCHAVSSAVRRITGARHLRRCSRGRRPRRVRCPLSNSWRACRRKSSNVRTQDLATSAQDPVTSALGMGPRICRCCRCVRETFKRRMDVQRQRLRHVASTRHGGAAMRVGSRAFMGSACALTGISGHSRVPYGTQGYSRVY